MTLLVFLAAKGVVYQPFVGRPAPHNGMVGFVNRLGGKCHAQAAPRVQGAAQTPASPDVPLSSRWAEYTRQPSWSRTSTRQSGFRGGQSNIEPGQGLCTTTASASLVKDGKGFVHGVRGGAHSMVAGILWGEDGRWPLL